MLLEHSLDAPEAAQATRDAVAATLAAGHRTADLAASGDRGQAVGCRRMGDLVLERLESA
jgi:3-isopropylmalate dehydrogenase